MRAYVTILLTLAAIWGSSYMFNSGVAAIASATVPLFIAVLAILTGVALGSGLVRPARPREIVEPARP
jgi:hypothetical protein